MIVYDLKTGEMLRKLPTSLAEVLGVEEKPEEPKIAPDVVTGEIAIMLTGLGADESYLTSTNSLPPEVILSYTPYAAKSLSASKDRSINGGFVAADIAVASGKFDLSEKNGDFRNSNICKAAMSKIYDTSLVYLKAPDTFLSSESFSKLAADLDENSQQIVVSSAYNGSNKNVIVADVYLPANATPEEILVALAKLEEASKANGYALAVIEPQAAIASILTDWLNQVKAKKYRITPAIKN